MKSSASRPIARKIKPIGMVDSHVTGPAARRAHPRWPLWVGLAVLALILAFGIGWNLAGGGGVSSRSTTARVGSVAPEIDLPQLIEGAPGANSRLTSFVGHPVVVNFWATWCGPCREEFPAIEAKYQEYKSRQLVVLGIDARSDAGPSAAQDFAREMKSTFPIWLDIDGTAEEAFHIQALPTTVFIDRSGVIQDMIVGGPLTADSLEKELKRIF